MRNRSLFARLALVLVTQACSSSSSPTATNSGGSQGSSSGGHLGASGGAAAGSGGVTGTGGGSTSTGGTGGDTTGSTGGQTGSGTGGGSGGALVGSGGASGGGVNGSSGGRSGGTGGGTSGTGGGGGSTGAGGLTLTASWPNGAILSAVRSVASPVPTQVLHLHNGGPSPTTVTGLTISGTNAAAFQLNGAPQVPFMLAAGADMPITVQVATSGGGLPPAPAQNSGATFVTAIVTAAAGTTSAQATLYGLVLTVFNHEPTLGQILQTLGYKLNVGLAQDNANPNIGQMATTLPKVEAGTDEIAAPVFLKAGPGNVTLTPVARYSPMGPMPFGWYPMGSSSTRNPVGTMASMPDAQTSDKARMVLPPTTGMTSFDPGAAMFGIWTYTDQASHLYDGMGTATTNGDYAYSEDSLNTPANVHRTKVYPLKDAAGVAVPGSYLLGVEEAGNGDYQDYVYVLTNVRVP